jgi:uncharacterized phage protein (TIGR01671 family)
MASIRSRIGENMEDRYLCKAKRKDNGEWVIGFYAYINKKHYIYTGQLIRSGLYDIAERFEVDPSTICQCIGLKDKNSNLIWENDIVRTIYDGIEHIYQVIWDKSELDFKATNGKEFYKSNFEYLPCCEEVEVIGNIFENKELLESEEQYGENI